MTSKSFFLLWLVSLIIVATAAVFFSQPGYMDAYYYYHVAANLAAGRGLVEDFVWNYLVPVDTIPHPSNLYWMPLTSLVGAPFLAWFGPSFRAAQAPLVLIASLVPPVAALVIWDLWRDRELALVSALLVLFGGFYFLYWTVIDSFGLFALAETGGLWAAARFLWQPRPQVAPPEAGIEVPRGEAVTSDEERGSMARPSLVVASGATLSAPARALGVSMHQGEISHRGLRPATELLGYCPPWLLGAVAGTAAAAAHLARGDGFLLLLSALGAFVISRRRGWQTAGGAALAAYLIVMGPWLLRTWMLTGSILPPGAASTAFLQEYNDFFSYAREHSLGSYLSWGLGPILLSKLRSFTENLVVLYGSGFMLLPFGLLALWQLRRDSRLFPLFLYAGLLYILLSLVFTFPGARGSMRHSAVALLPWTAVLAALGIRSAVQWAARRLPHWNARRAQRGFTIVALGSSLALSLSILGYNAGAWDEEFRHYQGLIRWLEAKGASQKPVMVTDPPAFFYASGRQAIVTPSDGLESLVAVADRYGVEYVALEAAHAPALDGLYTAAEHSPRLEPLEWLGSTRMFKVLR